MAITAAEDHLDKGTYDPDAEKAEDTQEEYQTDNKPADPLAATDDAHTKALTRKLLFKLDTR